MHGQSDTTDSSGPRSGRILYARVPGNSFAGFLEINGARRQNMEAIDSEVAWGQGGRLNRGFMNNLHGKEIVFAWQYTSSPIGKQHELHVILSLSPISSKTWPKRT